MTLRQPALPLRLGLSMLERLFVRQDGALRPVAFALAFRRSDGDLRQPLRKLLLRKNGATRPVLPPRLGVAIRAPWWKLWLARYDTPPAGWPLWPGADHPPQAQGVLVLLHVDSQTDLAFLDRLQLCGGLQTAANLTVVPRFTPDVPDAVRQKAKAYWPGAMPDDAPDRIILLDPRTLPRRHGLHLLLDALCRQTGAVLAFGDDMAIDRHGQVSDPWFKPGFDPLLAAQGMLPGPMTALRLDRLRNPQAIRASLRGDNTEPDDPLMTVLSDVSRDEVLHCPHVVAFRFERAVLPRRQIRPPLPDPLPIVSIIIPTRDGWDLLGPCLESLGQTDWPVAQREIIVVDNGSSDPACLAGLERAEAAGSVRVLRDPRPFNFAALNNRAVSLAKGDLLVFLNNDTLALRPDWLRVLSAFAWLPGAGAVGPKLLYADGRVQHAGLVFGLYGRAVHVHVGLPADAGGYQGLAAVPHEVSGVTGACLALRRAAFEAVGGFDEDFPVAYNDMVLCADLMKKGYRNLYVAEPLFFHLESRTRGNLDNPEKQRREADEAARARALHPDLFAADPHYSPNLSLDAPYVPAVPPRRRPPWDVAASQLHPAD
ncbi:MAG: glycosyltransferase family 2 protein [Rhodobacter sp.]|nr:glycosyltransferase family 2 protein [Rhodobacter sp.]MCA3458381.1 glycosyltransferase family 2 protein [Rhodobacter sp.]MCA3462644.1 glycosyltransferase family 2 protein [Rhodobacter sp.]MCA3463766.1 glycosyltransferase family 2 protein [Rhodobacter sp.]MCA3469138.1 glycosyltransferase family 2 protein [Rhodobacter sp.]